MRWIALLTGLVSGVANFTLLAAGCARLLGGRRRGALLILGGFFAGAAGLFFWAFISPSLLPWFGCACAGTLLIAAVTRMAFYHLRKK